LEEDRKKDSDNAASHRSRGKESDVRGQRGKWKRIKTHQSTQRTVKPLGNLPAMAGKRGPRKKEEEKRNTADNRHFSFRRQKGGAELDALRGKEEEAAEKGKANQGGGRSGRESFFLIHARKGKLA